MTVDSLRWFHLPLFFHNGFSPSHLYVKLTSSGGQVSGTSQPSCRLMSHVGASNWTCNAYNILICMHLIDAFPNPRKSLALRVMAHHLPSFYIGSFVVHLFALKSAFDFARLSPTQCEWSGLTWLPIGLRAKSIFSSSSSTPFAFCWLSAGSAK